MEILLNTEIIALNQDSLGVAGDLIAKEGPQEVCSFGSCSSRGLHDWAVDPACKSGRVCSISHGSG